MKQIVQSLKSKKTELIDIPAPLLEPGYLLVKTTRSLVSTGTEKMAVEFGRSQLINKIQQRPAQVKQVFDKIKSDGITSTMSAVRDKLDQDIPLGYCNVGTVIESGVDGFIEGDRVVSNGPHAEIVKVPEKLAAKIPDNVSDDEAVFTVLGSIGLQGIRLLNATFGETIVVIGLGLVGMITVKLLKASGLNVIGIDVNENKCRIAKSFGIYTINSSSQNPVKAVLKKSNDVGADGVLITATTKSNMVISQAAQMSRKKGKIVLVGVVGLEINRDEFYEKELSFQVSCSYGPGRYDKSYEQEGIDYPLPYVRWTEKRNFIAILESIRNNLLNVKDLISERAPFTNHRLVYDNIDSNESIATVLTYPDTSNKEINKKTIIIDHSSFIKKIGILGIIGAGNYTKSIVLPALQKTGADIKYIASANGVSGTKLARKYKIKQSTTDYLKIIKDNNVDTIIVTTRHDTHAKFVIESLQEGKNVFVEKPLAISEKQLDKIIATYQILDNPNVMVGFNRRFSPHLKGVKKALNNGSGPINIVVTVNAGFIPNTHWTQDIEQGGGRIIGEACHMMDVCVFLSGSQIERVCMNGLGKSPLSNIDNASLLLKLKNGSNAVINYFSNGSKSYSKERIEVYSQERTIIIDDFKTTKAYGVSGFRPIKTKTDKGQNSQFNDFIDLVINGGLPLIPFDDLINVSRASFAAVESMKKRKWIELPCI